MGILGKSLEESIEEVDLADYKGAKVSTFSNGQLISETDDRDLIKEKKLKIERMKHAMQKEFAALVPQHEQMNAALGVLDQAEADAVADEVARLRAKFRAFKLAVIEAETFEELESIRYDYEARG